MTTTTEHPMISKMRKPSGQRRKADPPAEPPAPATMHAETARSEATPKPSGAAEPVKPAEAASGKGDAPSKPAGDGEKKPAFAPPWLRRLREMPKHLKFRYPSGTRIDSTFDAAAERWTCVLIIEGEPVIEAFNSGIHVALQELAAKYRKRVNAACNESNTGGD